MKSYGQFCSIARALDLLGERWTLLIVRELLCGSRRFGDVRRGIPRISRTMLSARLRELIDAGVIVRDGSADDPSYQLTNSGLELAGAVRELGTWGQRWLPRELARGELDPDVLVWDMRRRVNLDALPSAPGGGAATCRLPTPDRPEWLSKAAGSGCAHSRNGSRDTRSPQSLPRPWFSGYGFRTPSQRCLGLPTSDRPFRARRRTR